MKSKERAIMYRRAAHLIFEQVRMHSPIRTGMCGVLPPLNGYNEVPSAKVPELVLFIPEWLLGDRNSFRSYWFGWPFIDNYQFDRINCLLLCAEMAEDEQ